MRIASRHGRDDVDPRHSALRSFDYAPGNRAADCGEERRTRFLTRGRSTEAPPAPVPSSSPCTLETGRKEHGTMALSDQLTALAARAKTLEDRAAAAKMKSKDDLQADVKSARHSADQQADSLRKSAENRDDKLSAWWDNVQKSWNENIASMRQAVDDQRAEHDVKKAQRKAESADEDAEFAIEYAFAAIEEAEYAVLDADLAHVEADELAAAGSTS
jgi:hypothetical protein